MSKPPSLLIFETHPVQYRAPVYRELQLRCPGQFEVIYGTDQSVRGWTDKDFGREVAWDEPLLEGYPCRALNNLNGGRLGGFGSLDGRGVRPLLKASKVRAVMLTSLRYRFDFRILWEARRLGCQIWLRHETQDEAFQRPAFKAFLRSLFFRLIYTQVDHAFYIGKLNQEHLLKYGVPSAKMTRAPYVTIDRFADMSEADSAVRRAAMREALGFKECDRVIAFFGKFISKKNPMLVLNAIAQVTEIGGASIGLLMVGSGELEPDLKERARSLAIEGVRIHFAGFINQSLIGDYYLAADVLVLPSRKMGETWGLVVNEALQAGCSVAMSDAVGCHAEFGHWERVRVFQEGSVEACSEALIELARFPRDLSWCRERMGEYSVEVAAGALAIQLAALRGNGVKS
jgi:glycosyltransferase involved in cell wall biosynthesis